MRAYHDKQCILCPNAATPAHIKGRGAHGDDVKKNICRLCGIHHTEQGAIGMTTFSKKYPVFHQWLVENGWVFNDFMGKWQHGN